MPMTPSLAPYDMDRSGILPCLSITSHSTNEKLGFPQLPSIYLIVQLQHTCRAVSELLTAIPVGNTFIKYRAGVKFLLPLVLQTLLISKGT